VIEYESDPLQDFAFTAFIDRFVFKNPKSKPKSGGASIMKPGAHNVHSTRLVSVSSAKFLERDEDDIPEEEVNEKKS
jgi:hypothetical protein